MTKMSCYFRTDSYAIENVSVFIGVANRVGEISDTLTRGQQAQYQP
jgi:hypothetical protein